MQPESVENVVVRSWRVFRANAVILVPGLVIGAIVGILAVLLAPPPIVSPEAATLGTLGGYALAGLVISVISAVAYIANVAYTTGMAAAAWRNGRTSFADGAAAFRRDGGHIFMATIGLMLIYVIAIVLAVPTLFLSLIATIVFTMYALPATVVDDMPGFAAIAASSRIAWARFVPTILIALVIAGVVLLVSLVGSLFIFVPFVGPVIQAILQQAVVAFATIVIVGEYINLRSVEAAPSAP